MKNAEAQRKTGRALYHAEAAAEYLISLLVTGPFLAFAAKHAGVSDSVTGILSSVISMGCLFQLLSVFIRKKRVKSFVIALSITDQLLFTTVYLIPLTSFSPQAKTVLFAGANVLAYIAYYVAHPKKISWLMSLVDDDKRGRFTADKEIISLISGMAFSYAMGAVTDGLSESGQTVTAFWISAGVITLLCVCHTLLLAFTYEEPGAAVPKAKSGGFSAVMKNRNVLKSMVVLVLIYCSTYVCTPFYGTYQIGELGFDLKFVSLLTIINGVSRIAFTRYWGKFADKRSFSVMMEKCLLIFTVGYAAMTAAVPENGAVMMIVYNVCCGAANAGLGSGTMNLVFDYSAPELRADALAVSQAAAGFSGFLTTLAASPIVEYVQRNGNRFLSVPVYAQQIVSALGALFSLAALLFIRFALNRKKAAG